MRKKWKRDENCDEQPEWKERGNDEEREREEQRWWWWRIKFKADEDKCSIWTVRYTPRERNLITIEEKMKIKYES